jgi:hypothetical protein
MGKFSSIVWMWKSSSTQNFRGLHFLYNLAEKINLYIIEFVLTKTTYMQMQKKLESTIEKIHKLIS